MTVIFTNLKLKESLDRLNKFIKSNRSFKYVSCVVLAAVSATLTVAASGVTLGYTVKYSDEVIAVVSSEADYKEANDIVNDRLGKETASQAELSTKFGVTLTVKDRLNSKEELADAILETNDDIVKATAIIVNDEVVLCVKDSKIDKLVDARLKAYYVEGAQNKSQFADGVKIEKGYFLKEDLGSIKEAKKIIETLPVETVSVYTTQVEVPFETKNVKTSDEPVGYSKVTTKGENGITQKTEEVTRFNGEVYSVNQLESVVVKEQVTQVVTVGTGVNYTSATEKSNASSAGFICPITSGRYTISAYYGDGRGHKGIDLAASKGTPIFAAAAGKVVSAGWDSDYGYNITIEHSNGMKTRYAHANALCVAKGDTVAQGDMIATVGNTGWSTGNHLHFEVIINGNRVNPGPYIGLR